MVTPASVIQLTWEPNVEALIRERIGERQEAAVVIDESVVQNSEVLAVAAEEENPIQQSSTVDDVPVDASPRPFIVGVIGIPGSGKSTSCSILTGLLRDLGSMLMPLDGYHHTKDALTKFPDPKDALYRRGAPDTFDAQSITSDLERIKYGSDEIVTIPDWDHAVADPRPHAYSFQRSKHRVVICEGLYLLHDSDGWETVESYCDMTIFVNANVDVCVERLKIRNKCIPGYTPEEIEIRCDTVDRANAMTVMASQTRATLIVESAAAKAVAAAISAQ